MQQLGVGKYFPAIFLRPEKKAKPYKNTSNNNKIMSTKESRNREGLHPQVQTCLTCALILIFLIKSILVVIRSCGSSELIPSFTK
jgi:hypothetical protein